MGGATTNAARLRVATVIVLQVVERGKYFRLVVEVVADGVFRRYDGSKKRAVGG